MKMRKLLLVILPILFSIIYIYYLFNKTKIKQIENFNHYKNPKYFYELPGHPHLDKRYGVVNLSIKEIHCTLVKLLKSFIIFCKKNDIKPILMYGALIGSWFNGKLLPWDDDIDFILTDPYISRMKNYVGDDYIIEVNPNSTNYSSGDKKNNISARIISTTNGVFIDILYHKENNGYLICKDENQYKLEDIYPLKNAMLEKIPIYIPNNTNKVLKKRYNKVHVKITAGIPTNPYNWKLIKNKYWLK